MTINHAQGTDLWVSATHGAEFRTPPPIAPTEKRTKPRDRYRGAVSRFASLRHGDPPVRTAVDGAPENQVLVVVIVIAEYKTI